MSSAASASSAPSSSSLAGKTVWVSGGSGFLGGALITRLVSLHGCKEVRAIGRSKAACDKLAALGATTIESDLSSVEKLTESMRGCSIAFHCAAFVGDWAPWDSYVQGTIVGTTIVVAACRAAGVPRLVHVSTEAVLINDDHAPLRNATEELVLAKEASTTYPYSKSKAEAERIVLAANDAQLTTVAMRPRYIWGAGDTVVFPRIADMARKGLLMFFGSGECRTSTCHVSNVCEGLELAALVRPEVCGGRAYFLTDSNAPLTLRETWGRMLATHGIPAPSRTIPWGVAWATAIALEKSSALCNRFGWQSVQPLFTRQAIALMGQDMTVSDARARKELGYKAQVSFELGLAEMREEYEQAQAKKAEASNAAGASAKK